jgi:folate-binding protein YgfZ
MPTQAIVLSCRFLAHCAIIEADKPRRSTYHGAVKGYYTELAQRGALIIRGPDTHKFLQGQTSCDLDLLTPDHAVNGAYCTAQGRMVCDFRILGCGDDGWLMCMHRGICDTSAAVFGKYIVFSKAEISNASEQWRSFAAWGQDLAETLALDTPGPGGVFELDGAWWVQTDEMGERFECHVPVESADSLLGRLDENLQRGEENDWQLAEINAGLGHVEPETVEMFIPQMLNYQLTGHVSFSKGCYTGQEIVARMHYRGKVKRPMYLASISAKTPTANGSGCPAAGTPLYPGGGEQAIGNVVNSARDREGYRMLAVVARKSVEAGVRLGGPEGPELSFHPLPYPLPDE